MSKINSNQQQVSADYNWKWTSIIYSYLLFKVRVYFTYSSNTCCSQVLFHSLKHFSKLYCIIQHTFCGCLFQRYSIKEEEMIGFYFSILDNIRALPLIINTELIR